MTRAWPAMKSLQHAAHHLLLTMADSGIKGGEQCLDQTMPRSGIKKATRPRWRDDDTPSRPAVALHLEGKKFESLKTSQNTAVMRAIKRDTVADIAEIRDVELACIDALFESLRGIAMEGPQLIEQLVSITQMALRTGIWSSIRRSVSSSPRVSRPSWKT